MLNQQQYHRRTFRGRGGPTDRRLPKHNAARRRPTREKEEAEVVAVDGVSIDETTVCESPQEDLAVAAQIPDDDFTLKIIDPAITSPELNDCSDTSPHVNEAEELEQEAFESYRKEVDHLLRRIRNNRTSMSLSNTALANPTSYQTNVLAACLNTFREWRSILRHHNLDEVTKKTTGLAIFELLQQSLQCGPLSGSQPGYFKRCGSETAAIVQNYLQDATVDTLCLSKNQADAIERWKDNALKAAASNKSPSKSVLKNREVAEKAKKKKSYL